MIPSIFHTAMEGVESVKESVLETDLMLSLDEASPLSEFSSTPNTSVYSTNPEDAEGAVPQVSPLKLAPSPDHIVMNVPYTLHPKYQVPQLHLLLLPVIPLRLLKIIPPPSLDPIQAPSPTAPSTSLITINVKDLYKEGSKKVVKTKDSLYFSEMVKFKQTARKTKSGGKQPRKQLLTKKPMKCVQHNMQAQEV